MRAGEPQGLDPLDTSVANPARVYDALLGGKDNFEADRAVAARMLDVVPQVRTAALDNRAFVLRAVEYLAGVEGVRQFVDVGAGLPTRGSVHEVAQRVDSSCRVVYVDYDPVVIAHARALLHERAGTTGIVQADMYDPRSIFDDPITRRLIDFDRPVGLVLAAVLHFTPDGRDPWGLVENYKDRLPPGSFLVASHGTADANPEAHRVTEVYEATEPLITRTYREIVEFFSGLELVDPGVTWVHEWRANPPETDPQRRLLYGGVGRKPGTAEAVQR